jgi:hypothetical protein
MRAHITRTTAGDRRKTAGRQLSGFPHRVERRSEDIHDRRLAAQSERVGSSFIVVTSFD